MTSVGVRRAGRPVLLALVGAVATLALVLMHGGVAHAAACSGSGPGMSMSKHDAPGQPVHVHGSEMCVSTPAVAGVDTGQHASTAMVELPRHALASTARPGRVVPATGREPPTPDPVSALRVSRR